MHFISKSVATNRQIKAHGNSRTNRLKAVWVENGKTGKWLVEQIGKNVATVSMWCFNRTQPSLDMLVKIAKLLNVDSPSLLMAAMMI